jgi:superfamily II DNA helicase RecQ
VVLDVGTGSGKTLCFSLPLLNEKDISITVSPLTALMIDQVSASQSSVLKEVKLKN